MGAPLRGLLDDIVRFVEQQAPREMVCSILLLDAPARCLRHGAAPNLPREYVRSIDGAAIGPRAGSCGTAAYRGQRVIVEDIAADPLWNDYRSLALPHGLRACWSTPILSAEREVLGTFAMYYRQTRRPHDAELAWVDAAAHLAAVAIARDRATGALQAAEARARQIARLYEVSSSVSDAIVHLRSVEQLYEAACRISVEHGLARLAWVGIYDAVEDRIVPRARHGEDRGYVDAIALGLRDDTGHGPAAIALRTGTSAVSEDIERDATFYWRDAALSRGLRSCAVFPLTIADKTIGILALYGERPHWFLAEERQVLGRLANNIAFAVESAGLERERRQLVLDLRRSEERLRAVIEHTPNVGIQWFDEQGRVLFCNGASAAMFGTSPADAIGKTLDQLGFTFAETKRFGDVLAKVAASGEPAEAAEFRFRRADGADGTLLSTVFRIPYPDGEHSYVCMDVDVTERKRAEEEGRLLEAQLQQGRRLEALGALAGGVAHDFNNILTAIKGNAALGLKGSGSGQASECLGEIRRAAERASDLVRRILTFGEHEAPRRDAVDLRAIVDEAIALLRASALSPHVEIRTTYADDTPMAAADATQLHQIAMNLGTNAVHAVGDAGGIIEFATAREVVARDGERPGLRAGEYVGLRVRDTGSGMDQATLERIFEPFFTTKEAGQGTGLGLSVVHGIVRAHGGAIFVRSEPGNGTAFDVLLPATAAPPAEISEPLQPASGEHVLYVDDEEALAYLAKRILEEHGYRVTAHTQPLRALEEFRAHPDAFAAVVSDLSMRGMSGLDLAREILAIRADVPVVLTSGYLKSEVVDAARELGVRGVMLKPATVEELGSSLHRLIGRSRDR